MNKILEYKRNKTSTTIFKQFMEAKNDTTHEGILNLAQPTYDCNMYD